MAMKRLLEALKYAVSVEWFGAKLDWSGFKREWGQREYIDNIFF